MTIVVVYKKRGRYAGFSARGHAEHGPYGEDIVCSAVSALLQSFIIGLDVANVPSKKLRRGLLSVKLKPPLTPKARACGDLLAETLFRSLLSIESQYPDNLTVIIKELPAN